MNEKELAYKITNKEYVEIGTVFKRDWNYIGKLYRDNKEKGWRLISLTNNINIYFGTEEEVREYFKKEDAILLIV